MTIAARRPLAHLWGGSNDGRGKDSERDEDFGEHDEVVQGRREAVYTAVLEWSGCWLMRILESFESILYLEALGRRSHCVSG